MRAKHHSIVCEYCGVTFDTNLPQAVFHSNACRQASYRLRKRQSLPPGERRGVGRPRKQLPESCNAILGGN